MALSGIPLMMYGVLVGSARINDNGTLDLIMTDPQPLGQDLLVEFETGQHTALAITPVGVPPHPQPAEG